jgi:hypothetical protein
LWHSKIFFSLKYRLHMPVILKACSIGISTALNYACAGRNEFKKRLFPAIYVIIISHTLGNQCLLILTNSFSSREHENQQQSRQFYRLHGHLYKTKESVSCMNIYISFISEWKARILILKLILNVSHDLANLHGMTKGRKIFSF